MAQGEQPASPPGAEPTAEAATAPETSAPPAAERPGEDWETRFKYLLADFENFRKRSDRDRQSQRRVIRSELLRSLIPLYEAFGQARRSIEARLAPTDAVRQGIELLGSEWDALWRAEALEPVAKAGEPFRAELHEAVGEQPPTAEIGEGRIVEVVQQGYRTRDALLRPAKVIVARTTEAKAPPQEKA